MTNNQPELSVTATNHLTKMFLNETIRRSRVEGIQKLITGGSDWINPLDYLVLARTEPSWSQGKKKLFVHRRGFCSLAMERRILKCYFEHYRVDCRHFDTLDFYQHAFTLQGISSVIMTELADYLERVFSETTVEEFREGVAGEIVKFLTTVDFDKAMVFCDRNPRTYPVTNIVDYPTKLKTRKSAKAASVWNKISGLFKL